MKIDKKNFEKQVTELVSSIPYGMVMTYGQIAALIGYPRAAQMVGWVLHSSDHKKVPYQRVVNRFGALAAGYTNGGVDGHREDLMSEGVVVRIDGTIDLEKYLWWPDKKFMD